MHEVLLLYETGQRGKNSLCTYIHVIVWSSMTLYFICLSDTTDSFWEPCINTRYTSWRWPFYQLNHPHRLLHVQLMMTQFLHQQPQLPKWSARIFKLTRHRHNEPEVIQPIQRLQVVTKPKLFHSNDSIVNQFAPKSIHFFYAAMLAW